MVALRQRRPFIAPKPTRFAMRRVHQAQKESSRTRQVKPWAPPDWDGVPLVNWNDPAIWPEGRVPEQNQNVIIERGTNILLTRAPRYSLGSLEIHGGLLRIDSRHTVDLRVSNMVGYDGAFLIGHETKHYRNRAGVTYTGAMVSPIANTGHVKSYMRHGTHRTEMWGWAPENPWTRLDAHVEAGTNVLVCRQYVGDWPVGKLVALGPSNHYGEQDVFYSRVASASGYTLTLEDNVPDFRWGMIQYLNDNGNSGTFVDDVTAGWSVTPGLFTYPLDCNETNFAAQMDQACHVGMIDCPLFLRGEVNADWDNDRFGFQAMTMDRTCVVRMHGVEYDKGGQAGHLGSYPEHWHLNNVHSTVLTPQSLADLSSAVTLTPPDGANICKLQATSTSALRYTIDGSTPTASVGLLIPAGVPKKIAAATAGSALPTIKVIEVDPGGGAKASFFGGTGAYLDNIPEGNAFMRKCVVKNSSQRGIVIHGSNGVELTSNILINIRGHGLFMEDGSELDNIFNLNLVMTTRNTSTALSSLGYSFQIAGHEGVAGGASGAWITCFGNIFTNNHYVDCEGFGQWGALPDGCMGLSHFAPNFPRHRRLILLDNNLSMCTGRECNATRFGPQDSIDPDFEGESSMYIPTYNDQPPADLYGTDLVRFAFTRMQMFFGYGAYTHLSAVPDYTGAVVSDCAFHAFVGNTLISGIGLGTITQFLISGNSLNASSKTWDPVGAERCPGIFDGQSGFTTYHGSVRISRGVAVGLPFVDGVVSGLFRVTDFYTDPTFPNPNGNQSVFDVAPGIRLINSHIGYICPPPHYAPGVNPDSTFNWTHALGVKNSFGYLGGSTEDNWWIPNIPYATYYAQGVQDPRGNWGKLCDGPIYGMYDFYTPMERLFGTYFAQHIKCTVLDENWDPVEDGEYDIKSGYDSTQLWNMRHFGFQKGGRYLFEFPTDGPGAGYFLASLSNLLTADDFYCIGIKYSETPSVVKLTHQGDSSVLNLTAVGGGEDRDDLYSGAKDRYLVDGAGSTLWMNLSGTHAVGKEPRSMLLTVET